MDKEPSETKETKTKTDAVAYKYVHDANGYSFPGVPARDLTKDEFDALNKEQKEFVTKSDAFKKGGR